MLFESDNLPYSNLHELNLDWIIQKWLGITKILDEHGEKIDELRHDVDALLDEIGPLLDKWIQENGAKYVEKVLREYLTAGVYFGLTQDGYFVAYIPESWSNINFRTTGYDTGYSPEYPNDFGRLVLYY